MYRIKKKAFMLIYRASITNHNICAGLTIEQIQCLILILGSQHPEPPSNEIRIE